MKGLPVLVLIALALVFPRRIGTPSRGIASGLGELAGAYRPIMRRVNHGPVPSRRPLRLHAEVRRRRSVPLDRRAHVTGGLEVETGRANDLLRMVGISCNSIPRPSGQESPGSDQEHSVNLCPSLARVSAVEKYPSLRRTHGRLSPDCYSKKAPSGSISEASASGTAAAIGGGRVVG